MRVQHRTRIVLLGGVMLALGAAPMGPASARQGGAAGDAVQPFLHANPFQP